MVSTLYPRESVRLVVPVAQDPSVQLVGILEKIQGNQDRGNKLALILHGAVGHKDYLFQKNLAQSLPLDSFRFDFRGNNESSGKTAVANFADDQEDLQTVVAHLVNQYDYKVALVVGHSRGSVMGLKWLCAEPAARHVEGFVNVSGRYRMNRILEIRNTLESHFKKQGYYDRIVRVAGRVVTVRSYPEDYDKFASWKNEFIWSDCPKDLDVLSIHGMKDEVVPAYDSLIWADAMSGREPGTHSLHLIEEGNHNLTAHRDEVVQTILDWWDQHSKKTLKGGLWKTQNRPRL